MRGTRMLGMLALLAVPLAAQQPAKPDTTRPMMPRMGQGMGEGRGMGMGQGMMGPGMMGMMAHMMQMHQMMGGGPQMMTMMRGMAFGPEHLLNRKDALELTPQQVTRLTAIRDAAKAAHDAAMADAGNHMRELADAMKAAAPDSNAMKTHFQAAHAAMGRAHWTMLTAATQARAVLTDVQRGRVEGMADAMMMQMHQRMQRMGGMHQGDDDDHPSR